MQNFHVVKSETFYSSNTMGFLSFLAIAALTFFLTLYSIEFKCIVYHGLLSVLLYHGLLLTTVPVALVVFLYTIHVFLKICILFQTGEVDYRSRM